MKYYTSLIISEFGDFTELASEKAPILLRVDVDYPYPSRVKSIFYLALKIKNRKSKDYLKNAHVIAKMVNESPNNVKAHWFFTPYTFPDKNLLKLLDSNRHQIGLHIVNNPYEELKALQDKTNQTIKHFTIHGTSRLLAQILWRRKIGKTQAVVPDDFPLRSFHTNATMSLDTERYKLGLNSVIKSAEEWIAHNVVLSFHPEWLFRENKMNGRGPFYDFLKIILNVDKELDTLRVRNKGFITIANDIHEYETDIFPTQMFIEKLEERNIDVFTFLNREWCNLISNPPNNWLQTNDNVGLLEIKTYEYWWQNIGKKTRNMVRRAEKSCIKTMVVQPDDKLAQGIWNIYNETPIRQERAFSHYGESLDTVTANMFASKDSTFIGAFLLDEIVGFVQIVYGDNVAIISNILALKRHQDKAINNSLIAKTVEVCVSKSIKWLMYGRIGNHPSLDKFKESNGFVKFPITRYYVPITRKGRLAIRIGSHRELKDVLPNIIKYFLIPVVNWASRIKVRFKFQLKKEKRI